MPFDLRPGVRRLFRLPLSTPDATRQDVDDELGSLIDSRVESLVAQGMSPGDARTEALRHLGPSLDDARKQLHSSAHQRERRMQVRDFVDGVIQDIHYAARGLVRRPGFTVVAVLTLAIGVGATTAIFSAVNALLLRPLPYVRPGELMQVSLMLPAEGGQPSSALGWSYPMYAMFRDAQRMFADEAVYTGTEVTLTSGDVERVTGEYVGASYLQVLGLSPSRGRDFAPAQDAQIGGPHEVIVSYALWQRRFNGDPSIVGRSIDIDRVPWTIIGVGPRAFRGLLGQADLLLPVSAGPPAQLAVQNYPFWLVARRAPGVTETQATGAAATLGTRVGDAFPNPMGGSKWQVAASPLNDARLDPTIERSLLVLSGAVVLVLLIACVNVANLLLGRASARGREIAVRVAIGASRARLARLLVTESLMLSLVGAVASVAVAWVCAHLLSTIDPTSILNGSRSRSYALGVVGFSSIALDWWALAFTFGVSLVVGVLFGLAPALAAARESLSGALKGDRVAGGARAGRRALVVAEVAVALVLLVSSGLMVRSLANLLATDSGVDATNVLTFRVTLPPGSLGLDSLPGFYQGILDRVRGVPGVADAALDACAPLSGTCFITPLGRDHAPTDYRMSSMTNLEWVTPSWFSVMRVPLRRGRMFTDADRSDAPRVVLLNESAAKKFFADEDPIGKHVTVGGLQDAEVIGVVAGVRQRPDSAPGATTYVAYAQSPRPRMMVFVRVSRDAPSIGTEVRRAIHEVAPQVPVYDMQTMAERTAAATAQARFRALLLTAFAIVALSLAAIGIYGVMTFAVTARIREMGIRIALGAGHARVQRLVIGEGLGLVGLGALIGLAGALAATRVLRTFLFDLTPSDPGTYAAIFAVLAAVAALASWIPARRASRVDPVVALRAE
ncbi:MAG TPA: ABC transporter permease [Gemmatimonadales bacterium]|nr:ABC transporter permease [Gemmatimonadales bacterium]